MSSEIKEALLVFHLDFGGTFYSIWVKHYLLLLEKLEKGHIISFHPEQKTF